MSKQKSSSAKQLSQKKTAPIIITDNSQKLQRKLFWFLSVAAFLIYASSIGHGFVLDDLAVIENNRFVQEGISGIPELFSTFYWKGFWDANAGLYRPLSMVMFAIEWAISPNNPGIHHFINVLLYAITIGVLFKLLLKLLPTYSVWVSFSIALLFMVHPSHTEVVANIKSRDEILCFLFFLLTFHQLLKTGKCTILESLKIGLLFFACLLSKEAGIMYLPVFAIYFWMVKKYNFGTLVKQLLPLVIISAGWLMLHQAVILSDANSPIHYSYHDNSLLACEGSSRYATGVGILGRYLLECIAPFNLSYDYSYHQLPCLSFTSLPVIITLVVVLLSALLVIKTRKTRPEIAFGILFFFITIALVTNIFSLIGATYANRLIYAPSLGILLAIVIGVFTLFNIPSSKKWRSGGALLLAIITLIYLVHTIQRTKVWESNTTLFTADVENSPNSARVHFNYGVLLMNTDQLDSLSAQRQLSVASASFLKATTIDSLDLGSYINLGVTQYRMQKFEQSIKYTLKAISIQPTDTSLYGNLGDAYFALNDFDEASKALKTCIQWSNASSTNFKRCGVSLFNLKRYTEAIEVFKEGVEKFPGEAEMATNLGNAYGASGNYREAVKIFETIYKNDPSNVNALRFLVLTYQQLGDQAKVDEYSRYLR